MKRHRLLLFALCLLLYANYSLSNPVQDAASAVNPVADTTRATVAQLASKMLNDAEQGNAGAQAAVGNFYRTGTGLPQDFVQAYKWLFLSAAVEGGQKENAIKALEAAAAQMTQQQIEQARQLAAEWKPRTNRGGGIGTGSGTGVGPGAGPGSGRGIGVAPEPYAIGSGVTKPVGLIQPLPPYTEDARKARIEGIITLQCIVHKDGTVGVNGIIKGLGFGLDESAIKTVSEKWRFKPGARNGEPIDVSANIEINMKLY